MDAENSERVADRRRRSAPTFPAARRTSMTIEERAVERLPLRLGG
jgi:hypothetical protein